MKEIDEWILQNIPQDPNDQLAKCVEYVAKVREQFPNLKIAKGVVSSSHNLDNMGEVLKEYPHTWLETMSGKIIDPTVKQYSCLGELKYRKFPPEATQMHKCIGCGKYYTNLTSRYYPYHSMECFEKWS